MQHIYSVLVILLTQTVSKNFLFIFRCSVKSRQPLATTEINKIIEMCWIKTISKS